MEERRKNADMYDRSTIDKRKTPGRKKMKTFSKLTKTAAASLLAISLTACTANAAGTSTSSTSAKTGANSTYAYLLDTTDLDKPEVDTSNATGVLADILQKGVLTIATSPDYPPVEFVDDEGKVWGSEMKLAKYVADRLGVDLDIETMDFSGTLVAVDTGKVDLAFSGYGWKKDRAESYELSIGYEGDPDSTESSKHTLITTAANEGKYNSLSDFVGSHIMAQATSLQEMYVQDEILSLDTNGTTNYEPVSTLDQAILGLASGKCDAVALDNSTAENYVKSSDGQFVLTNVYFDLTPYGDYQGNVVAGKKGETSLMDAVNTIITAAKNNGYYETWYTEAKEQAGVTE
jgi:polar amino acid transport system substrate-binding protein